MQELLENSKRATVAVIGGGLAGMAAAVAAADHGFRVEVFEGRRALGGRAASFRDRATDRLVDLCQHVGMGCCTNLADLLRRLGVEDAFATQRRVHFVGPSGSRHTLAAVPLLPAPLHLGPGLLRLGYLRFADRWHIARTLWRLARSGRGLSQFSRRENGTVPFANPGESGTVPLVNQEAISLPPQTVGPWLRRQGESDRAIERFWEVVLVSALGETLDRASLGAARKVFVDGFLASRRAYELMVPRAPLEEILDQRAGDRLAAKGVILHRGVRVRRLEGDARRAEAVVLADGSHRPFDFFVVAVPWRNVGALLSPAMLDAMPALAKLGQIEPAPITAVHLWLDRPATPLANAALVGRLSDWVFRPAYAVEPGRSGSEHYCQVVISASHKLLGRRVEDVAGQVFEELRAIWPEARQARLLRFRVITNRRAVFSVRPGIDDLRPKQTTPIDNVMVAGDWTATGWPATMEGAVRSGYLAVEAILNRRGDFRRILVPDLPWGPFSRWVLGNR